MLALFFIICSGVSLFAAIIILYGKMSCSEPVQAEYKGEAPYHSSQNVTRYAICLEYQYQGKAYSSDTFEAFSKKEIQKSREKKYLQAFVNPKNPKRVCIDKSIHGNDMLLFFLGIVFLFAAYLA